MPIDNTIEWNEMLDIVGIPRIKGKTRVVPKKEAKPARDRSISLLYKMETPA